MTAVLLDTHVVHWWSAEPGRVSDAARAQLEAADDLAVASVSWYELAWLARHERIVLNIPVRSWLEGLGANLRTIGMTPAIADMATSLPTSFPGDPADRQIYATAIELGLKLVTKDGVIREHDGPRSLTVW
ncbi:MAG TPA: type II toxin-antitoxin system VapC family toxin [Solirubrobacterales bacterium]|nr:type II toxin-antitoxin system VapC family toxin [Solirubrobacterales bacterium]